MDKDPDPKYFTQKAWKDIKCNAADKGHGLEKAIVDYAAAVKKTDDDKVIGKVYKDLLKLLDKIEVAAKKILDDLKNGNFPADVVKYFTEYPAKIAIEKKRLGDASKLAAKSLDNAARLAKEEAQEEEDEEDEGIAPAVRQGVADLLSELKKFLAAQDLAEKAQEKANAGRDSASGSARAMIAFEKDASEADMSTPQWESLRGNFAAAGSALVGLEKECTKTLEKAESALAAAATEHTALLKLASLPPELRSALQEAAKAFV